MVNSFLSTGLSGFFAQTLRLSLTYVTLDLVPFLPKIIAKVVINSVALYVSLLYFPQLVLQGGILSLLIAGIVLALLNAFLRPVLRVISAPLVWVTFGVFHIAIHVAILWIADRMLTQLTIGDLPTLFWVSIIIALANTFF